MFLRGGRHSLVVFFGFPTEEVELPNGGSVSCERRSFFSLRHTVGLITSNYIVVTVTLELTD